MAHTYLSFLLNGICMSSIWSEQFYMLLILSSMYDTQLKLIATTKMKGEQKEINKEKRKQEDEERNLKNDIPNALTGFLLNISILSPDWANLYGQHVCIG